jgi:hypothetical protein
MKSFARELFKTFYNFYKMLLHSLFLGFSQKENLKKMKKNRIICEKVLSEIFTTFIYAQKSKITDEFQNNK